MTSLIKSLFLLLTISLTFGCNSKTETLDTPAKVTEIDDIIVPTLKLKGLTVIEALNKINSALKAKYPDHPHLPIIILRHDYSKMDLGNEIIDFNTNEGPLPGLLSALATTTLNHYRVSQNGFIIFKTWHRPQFDYDDRDPSMDFDE